MGKHFDSIAIEVPEGHYPVYYEMQGRLLRIFLTQKDPSRVVIEEFRHLNPEL